MLISLDSGFAVVGCEVLTITNFYLDGVELIPSMREHADAVVAGPDTEGQWYSLAVFDFRKQVH